MKRSIKPHPKSSSGSASASFPLYIWHWLHGMLSRGKEGCYLHTIYAARSLTIFNPLMFRRIKIRRKVFGHLSRNFGRRFEFKTSNTTSERPNYHQADLNLQTENCGATPESLDVDEEEDDHLIDDEDDEIICID